MSEKKSTSSNSGQGMSPLVMLLWISSLAWLTIGLGLGFIAALKMHATGLFSNVSWLNFGTLTEVSESILLYGFVLQAVFAGVIGMVAQSTNSKPGFGHVSTIGVVLYNKLLTIGIIQIFIFGTTGLKFMSLTPQMQLGLIIASLFITLPWITRTLSINAGNKTCFSYFLLALLIFPMIALPAGHLVHRSGVTGVVQNAIALWYGHTLIFTLIPIFLFGTLLYHIENNEKIKNFSRAVPTAALWCFIIGGFLGGLYHGFPIGGAVNALSVSSTWFPALGAVSLFITFYQIAKQNGGKDSFPASFGFKFVAGGVMIVLAINAITSLKGASGSFGLTPFKLGLEQFLIFGTLLMGAVLIARNALSGDFKPSAAVCFAIYLGSLICLAAFTIEALAGNASGLRMHILGLLVALAASVLQLLTLLKASCEALTAFCKQNCKQSQPAEKSKLASA